MKRLIPILGFAALVGCAGNRHLAQQVPESAPALEIPSRVPAQAKTPAAQTATAQPASSIRPVGHIERVERINVLRNLPPKKPHVPLRPSAGKVSADGKTMKSEPIDKTVVIDGRTYKLELVGPESNANDDTEIEVEVSRRLPIAKEVVTEDTEKPSPKQRAIVTPVENSDIRQDKSKDPTSARRIPKRTPVDLQVAAIKTTAARVPKVEDAQTVTPISDLGSYVSQQPLVGDQPNAIHLNLPSALSMVDGQHPAVGFARWRVQEAYALLAAAEVMWLPSIQAGLSFHRHDGNYQASNSTIVDVNRNSFQYGFGTGATGAGTTPRPGIVARFHLADAVFQPKIAAKTAWARGHAAKAAVNQQMFEAGLAYISLLDAYQDVRVLEESRTRVASLAEVMTNFVTAGEGLKADSDRMQTELMLVNNRTLEARERIGRTTARLAQALSMDTSTEVIPLDVTVVPLELVNIDIGKSALIGTALSNRPELKESQALVAAACEAYKLEKTAPFVPSVLLGFSTSGFGGGQGSNLNSIDGRYDLDALLSWEVRHLGFGERAARRATSARIQQAKFEKLRVMDQVAFDVSESCSQIQFRRERMMITRQAVQNAESSHIHNLDRIRGGHGTPLEALQSVQALEVAKRAYLRSVIEYNQSQFRLQWALGWPVHGSIDDQLSIEESSSSRTNL